MLDPIEPVLKAIERGSTSAGKAESQVLDFKTEKSTPKETYQDIAEAAVCFANAAGGTIVLGVADTGTGHDVFLGSKLDARVLRTKIHDLTEPRLTVAVRELEWAGARLLVVEVPEGLDVFSTGRGSFYQRWNDQCLPMRSVDVARLNDERSGMDWSAQASGRAISDIDLHAIQVLRGYLRATGDESRGRLAARSDHEIVRELSLVAGDGTLTRAAEYLLCKPRDGVTHDILVYQHRMTRSGEADHVRRWQSPMLPGFAEAMTTISARIGSTPVNTNMGQQISVEDYPTAAVREALANALIHGELREERPVQVEHSPETLAVRSPGPLVSGITPENILTHGSRARFPLIAATMRTLGLAEELGQGVDRMFREMVRNGRTVPRVQVREAGAAETSVDFTGGPPNVRLAKFVAELPEAERGDTDALLITLVLCDKRSVTARDIAPIIQRGIEEAEGVLRRLAHGDAHMIEPTAGTSNRLHPNYRFTGSVLASLGTAVAYSRRSASETDRKIVDHLRDYGTINNSTIQRIFDVDVYQARDILRDLVGRELLVRVSEQTRGVAVKYGPGPRFPTKSRKSRQARHDTDGTLF